MRLEYTDEATFITEQLEFSDEHYSVIENLYNRFEGEKISPIMVSVDKKSLIFGIRSGERIGNRVAYDCSEHTYKVIVGPLNGK